MQYQRSERVRRELTRLLHAGVSSRVFPGASVSVVWREPDRVVDLNVVSGVMGEGGAYVSDDASYDLGGVTRLTTTVLAMRLAALRGLDFDARLKTLLPDLHDGPGAESTLRELLCHVSPLAAWGGLYLDVPHDKGSPAARRWMIAEAARRSRERHGNIQAPGDLGYLLLGEALATFADGSIEKCLREWVTDPLGIADSLNYFASWPLSKRAKRIRKTAPTERCQWRGKVSHGDVFDENCAAMGGMAGHSGLFGTASAVSRLGLALLDCMNGSSDFLSQDDLRAVLHGESSGAMRMGFRVKQEGDRSFGRRLSIGSFGAAGDTGAVLMCDPSRGMSVAFLCNRVHPTRSNEKLLTFLPAFLDGLFASWDYRRPVSIQPRAVAQPVG